MATLGKAIAIASTVHADQVDRGGNAYILHPMRIMQRLRTTDAELMQIAIMHDVIEDSDYTIESLQKEGFSKRVLAALECLTHHKDEEYDDYIRRISTNDDAILVKLEDLRDNSDITRLKGITQKDFERVQKYHRSYIFLTEAKKLRERIYHQ